LKAGSISYKTIKKTKNMKNLFILLLVVFAGGIIFANTNNNTSTTPPATPKDTLTIITPKVVQSKLPASQLRPKKGEILISADDSVLYRKSDSALIKAAQAVDVLPTGFPLVEKPR